MVSQPASTPILMISFCNLTRGTFLELAAIMGVLKKKSNLEVNK